MNEFDRLALQWNALVTPAAEEAKRLLEGRGFQANIRFLRGAPTLLLVQVRVFAPGRLAEPYLLEVWFGEARTAGVDSDGYLCFAAISDSKDNRLDRAPNLGKCAADGVCRNEKELFEQIGAWLSGGFLYQFVVTTLDHTMSLESGSAPT